MNNFMKSSRACANHKLQLWLQYTTQIKAKALEDFLSTGHRLYQRWRLFLALESLGQITMDLGFGAFLEKFEDHFGRVITKILLVVIGLAVTTLCFGLIFQNAIKPLYLLISSAVSISGIWETAVSIFWLAIGIGAGFSVGSVAVTAMNNRRLNKQVKGDIKEAKAILRELKNLSERTSANYDKTVEVQSLAQSHIDETSELFRNVVALTKKSLQTAVGLGTITQQQADDILVASNQVLNGNE